MTWVWTSAPSPLLGDTGYYFTLLSCSLLYPSNNYNPQAMRHLAHKNTKLTRDHSLILKMWYLALRVKHDPACRASGMVPGTESMFNKWQLLLFSPFMTEKQISSLALLKDWSDVSMKKWYYILKGLGQYKGFFCSDFQVSFSGE